MADGTWSATEAKAKFGEVVDRARTEGPQHVVRNGREVAVVLSAAEFERLSGVKPKPKRSVIDVLTDPSIRGLLTDEEVDTLFARDKDIGRPPPDFS